MQAVLKSRIRRSGRSAPDPGPDEFREAVAYLMTVRRRHGTHASMECLSHAARDAARRHGETQAHAVSAFGDYAEGPLGPPPAVVRDTAAYVLGAKRAAEARAAG